MNDGGAKSGGSFMAVHQCEKCGATSSPIETNDEVNVTGVVVCLKCGHTGPLRVVIVDDRLS